MMPPYPKAFRSQWLGSSGVGLSWRIDNLATVMETWESVRIMSGASETGPFETLVDVVPLVADQHVYSYTHGSGTETTFYVAELYESVGPTSGDQVGPVAGSGGGLYLSVQNMRDYGWSIGQVNDKTMRALITEAEAALHSYTGQVFIAEQKTVTVDGSGSKELPLQEVIIQIDSAELIVPADADPLQAEQLLDFDLDYVTVYNRHLTQRLRQPDDRESPSLHYISRFPSGSQNVRLSGWFGYTELEPDEIAGAITGTKKPLSRGQTPPLVKRAVMMLAARFMPTPADMGAFVQATKAHALTMNKMRDQQQSWAATALVTGGITGDPEVDGFIAMFQCVDSVEFV